MGKKPGGVKNLDSEKSEIFYFTIQLIVIHGSLAYVCRLMHVLSSNETVKFCTYLVEDSSLKSIYYQKRKIDHHR